MAQQAPPPPNPRQPKGKYFGYELASAGQRLSARIVGSLIVFVPFQILFGDSLGNDPFIFHALRIIVAILLGSIFYPRWSGNLGHKIMGLKVISAIDGSDKRDAGLGALREGLNYIFGIVIIPVIWLLWDNDKQNLYDKVVKTYVVKNKQKRLEVEGQPTYTELENEENTDSRTEEQKKIDIKFKQQDNILRIIAFTLIIGGFVSLTAIIFFWR